mgnify:CR=1 FL=1
MKIKTSKGLKVTIIAVVLLLCLALAIGITGAFYQAKRQATGTLSMDQGIIIDYKGFGKTPDEGIWTRETTTTFLLFDETNAQPGQNIPVNAAGIRANAESVNFYARVKLSYKFYNGETPVEFAESTKLIKTSSDFFGTNWVESGDGYFYYATGSTLNKFTKTATTFVDLFATDAKFIIEGAGFTGADNNGEGGGFKIDETTSINKIEVYLTLETLQGDATAEQAKALGWKISSEVNFAKVDEGKIVKSGTQTEFTADEIASSVGDINVTIGEKQSLLRETKFPYDEEVTLKFDTRNVDYITLKYSTGAEETFGEKAEDFANDYLSETALKVTAKSEKGTVKGYTVGLWDSEYTGFTYKTNGINLEEGKLYEILNGLSISKYLGSDKIITIPNTVKVRNRDFKLIKFNLNPTYLSSEDGFLSDLITVSYPCKFSYKYQGKKELIKEFNNVFEATAYSNSDQFTFRSDHSNDPNFSKYEFIFEYSTLCETSNNFFTSKDVLEIGEYALKYFECDKIVIGEKVEKIGYGAFDFSTIKTIEITDNITSIGESAFWRCNNLTEVIIDSATIAGLGSSDSCLLDNATKVYVKDGLTVGSYITGSFTKAASSDREGYVLYTKNA